MSWCSIEHIGLECRCCGGKLPALLHNGAFCSKRKKEESDGDGEQVGVLGSNATSAVVAGT
jgi:hypothetical protein